MKLLSLQLPDTTRANDIDLNGCKACICADYVHAGLRFPTKRLFTRKRNECRPHKQSVVCFQDRDFGLSNVAEALQQIGVRLIKTEQIARFGEYLKRNGVSLERFHLTPASRGNALWESANRPFVKISANKDSDEKETQNHVDFEFPFVSDWMVDTSTPRGDLSVAAISCIEQFSRLNGLTGKQMRQKFYSESPVSVQNEARNLVEYCCFRYLSKSSTDFHPYLKEAAFRRLIFITMLAWQQPYGNAENNHAMVHEHENVHGSGKAWIVGEDAFTRIAPAISGVADRSTAHHLFKALTSDNEGLSFSVWNTYISELLRVHEERLQHRIDEGSTLSLNAHECVLCVGANKRQPVQMWNKNNIPWPGRLTLTERALYFEPNGMIQHRTAMKLDLQGGHGNVERKKVGPFGAPVLDSAITVSANAQSEPWILEFVDFSGHGRREVWFAFIDEILSVYSFISEYGPAVDDPFLPRVYGSQHGRKKAVTSAVNGIARVQAVQSTLGRLLEHPGRLLQFSHLKNAPCGELVKQTLAVAFWGGHLEANHRDLKRLSEDVTDATDGIGTGLHIVDVDGSVYLQRWMKSSTWESSMSSTFWKQKVGGKGLIVGKDLIVGDLTYLDKAVKACKDQSQILERTKATIDGALVKGIPSNIDLFKELMVPFTALSINVRKLQKWECPPLTVLFLAICSLVLYKNWLKFFAPALLLTTAVLVFTLHNQKLQGRLGDNFGRVIIREQPPSNTLQKIISLKEALAKVEIQIQKVNVALLKLRSLALAGHPQGKNMVAFAMLGAALILLFVPFRIVCAFLIFDQFTCELEFRRGMVLKLARQLNDWWETIPAAPVVVLPYDSHQDTNEHNIVSEVDEALPPTKGEAIAEAVREWFASEQNST